MITNLNENGTAMTAYLVCADRLSVKGSLTSLQFCSLYRPNLAYVARLLFNRYPR